jgi:hypothetical protein
MRKMVSDTITANVGSLLLKPLIFPCVYKNCRHIKSNTVVSRKGYKWKTWILEICD